MLSTRTALALFFIIFAGSSKMSGASPQLYFLRQLNKVRVNLSAFLCKIPSPSLKKLYFGKGDVRHSEKLQALKKSESDHKGASLPLSKSESSDHRSQDISELHVEYVRAFLMGCFSYSISPLMYVVRHFSKFLVSKEFLRKTFDNALREMKEKVDEAGKNINEGIGKVSETIAQLQKDADQLENALKLQDEKHKKELSVLETVIDNQGKEISALKTKIATLANLLEVQTDHLKSNQTVKSKTPSIMDIYRTTATELPLKRFSLKQHQ